MTKDVYSVNDRFDSVILKYLFAIPKCAAWCIQ